MAAGPTHPNPKPRLFAPPAAALPTRADSSVMMASDDFVATQDLRRRNGSAGEPPAGRSSLSTRLLDAIGAGRPPV